MAKKKKSRRPTIKGIARKITENPLVFNENIDSGVPAVPPVGQSGGDGDKVSKVITYLSNCMQVAGHGRVDTLLSNLRKRVSAIGSETALSEILSHVETMGNADVAGSALKDYIKSNPIKNSNTVVNTLKDILGPDHESEIVTRLDEFISGQSDDWDDDGEKDEDDSDFYYDQGSDSDGH